MRLEEVDTPALLIDLDAFERNLRRMAEAAPPAGRPRLRAHAKTHKSPAIAHQQIALGAIGICCQKVSEAEIFVADGVADVLVSNEVAGAAKLRRLAGLARQARIGICVDDAGNIADLEAAAAEIDVRLRVLVEIDVGAARCGVAPGEPAVRLAELIARSPHLEFDGLQAYHGSAQHIRNFGERRAAIRRAADMADHTRTLLRRRGLDCPTVTGAGTGSYRFEIETGVYDELQCGSYVFMDADYARNLDAAGSTAPEFEHSLFIWATVMSRPTDDRAVVDAGLKSYSTDSGMPIVCDAPEAVLDRASDEHGRIILKRPSNAFRVGDKIRLIPGHCDPTVNLHDWYVGVRNGRVETLWPIAARGALT
ncbi:MAG: DSD1 family PLP-dependent enzyme [Alphaproteobacteria bacterium]|nr:DSD1 family PLP-dependent enzyme [Alphaproteobacteria bacterium]